MNEQMDQNCRKRFGIRARFLYETAHLIFAWSAVSSAFSRLQIYELIRNNNVVLAKVLLAIHLLLELPVAREALHELN